MIKVDGEFISVGTRQTATDRTITPEDVTAIAKLPMVTAVAPHQDIESLVVSSGRRQTNTWLAGVTAAYADVQNQRVEAGRLLSSTDFSFGRSVMVLGMVASDRLFADRDPIGKTVRVGNQGVRGCRRPGSQGKARRRELDNRIFVPLPLVTGVLRGGPNVVHADLRVRSENDIEPAMDEIRGALRSQHKLPPSYPDDFSVEDQASIVKGGAERRRPLRVLTFALGEPRCSWGIGIANMMLVSVHERTREIGIRKSSGPIPGTFRRSSDRVGGLETCSRCCRGAGGDRATRAISTFRRLADRHQSALARRGVFRRRRRRLAFGFYPPAARPDSDPIAALRYE